MLAHDGAPQRQATPMVRTPLKTPRSENRSPAGRRRTEAVREMKTCFVSCQYPPLSRTLRRYKFARYLADGGLQVEVVAHGNISRALGTFSQDPSMVAPAADLPVHRPRAVPWYLLGELLYRTGLAPCPYVNWYAPAVRVACRVAASRRAAVVGVYPPLVNLLVAYRTAQRTGARLVLDFRDEYRGLSRGLQFPWARYWERRLVTAADLVSAATEPVAVSLRDRYGLPAERLHLTPNGYWEDVPAAASYRTRETVHVVYAGALSPVQGIDLLCAAMRRLQSEQPEVARRLRVTVYGPENLYLRRRLRPLLDGAGMRFGGFLNAAQVSPVLLDADVCYVSLASDQHAYAVPGKLYECIAHARPILAVLPPGTARSIIEEHGFGLVANCGSVEMLTGQLLAMLDPERRQGCFERLLASREAYAARPQFLSLARRLRELE